MLILGVYRRPPEGFRIFRGGRGAKRRDFVVLIDFVSVFDVFLIDFVSVFVVFGFRDADPERVGLHVWGGGRRGRPNPGG